MKTKKLYSELNKLESLIDFNYSILTNSGIDQEKSMETIIIMYTKQIKLLLEYIEMKEGNYVCND